MRALTRPSEALVAASARGLTRRRMFRNAGGVALGAAVATAYFRPGGAEAQCGNPPGACGPAPLCGCSRCNAGPNDQCDVAEARVEKARWGSGAQPCIRRDGRVNCWQEGSIWCCDCCVRNAGCQVTRCTSGGPCGSNWWKCICKTGANCS
jgi:hypothetical protein